MAIQFLHFLANVVYLRSFPIFCVYLLIIFLSGKIIKRTNPIELRKTLIIYSAGCSILSLYNLYLFSRAYLSVNVYQTIYDKSPGGTPFQLAFDIYSITKYIELADTLFMIIRHRSRQISFLHVYHHASMLLLADLCANRYPWVGMAFYLAMNAFIHVILYAYYAISAAKPLYPLTWKQRITELQILQFLIGMVFSINGYMKHGYCVYGPFYGLSMSLLFGNFYWRAYIKRQRDTNKENNGTISNKTD